MKSVKKWETFFENDPDLKLEEHQNLNSPREQNFKFTAKNCISSVHNKMEYNT